MFPSVHEPSPAKKDLRPGTVPTLLAAFVLLLSVLAFPAPVAAHPVAAGSRSLPTDDDNITHPTPFVWSNGRVNLSFAGDLPRFSLLPSSPSSGNPGLTITVMGFAEIAPNGNVDAVAPFLSDGSSWNLSATNTSSGGVEVFLNGSASEAPAAGSWNSSEFPEPSSDGSLASVGTSVNFTLLPGPVGSAAWSVRFDLSLQGWTWARGTDLLGVGIELIRGGASTWQESSDGIEETLNSTGEPVVHFNWTGSVHAQYPGGPNATGSVSPPPSSLPFPSPGAERTLLHLEFSGIPGGYVGMTYDPTVTLVPPSGPSGRSGELFPPSDLTNLVGVGLGAAFVLAFVVVIRHRRRDLPPPEWSTSALWAPPRCPGIRPMSAGAPL